MKLVEFKKSSGKCKALVESARIQHVQDQYYSWTPRSLKSN